MSKAVRRCSGSLRQRCGLFGKHVLRLWTCQGGESSGKWLISVDSFGFLHVIDDWANQGDGKATFVLCKGKEGQLSQLSQL